jgi:hypothetical protein
MQWAEGLSFTPPPTVTRSHKTLTWLTPVDLRPPPTPFGSLNTPSVEVEADQADPEVPVPTLQFLLEALLVRVAQLTPGKYTTPGDVWQRLSPDEQAALWDAVIKADHINLRQVKPAVAPPGWPGGWLGEQTFAAMPASLLPYLELGSILHLGRQTHLGCGTFVI